VSVAELERREGRRRKVAEAQEAEWAKERQERRQDPPERVLTLADATPALGRASLRELARRLEAAGGVLVVERDGGLTVRVKVVSEQAVRVGQALSLASETILTLVKRKPGAIDPEALPDAQLTLSGDPVPAALRGRSKR
jgi:hypothetical protein